MILQDATAVAQCGANLCRNLISQTVDARARALVALSGGSTPREMYTLLGGLPGIAWQQVQVFLVDERWVPVGAEASNAELIRSTLMASAAPRLAQFFEVDLEAESPRRAAKRYNARVHASLQSVHPHRPALHGFDIVTLGVGEDGHIASLFADLNREPGENWVRAVAGPASLGRLQSRVSLTYRSFEKAANLVILVTGCSKRFIMRRVYIERSQRLSGSTPASRLAPHNRLTWLLDAGAASLLPVLDRPTVSSGAAR